MDFMEASGEWMHPFVSFVLYKALISYPFISPDIAQYSALSVVLLFRFYMAGLWCRMNQSLLPYQQQ